MWAEARRNCQQEGATLAVVNSEREADNLRSLYVDYGPVRSEGYATGRDETTILEDSTSPALPTAGTTPEPTLLPTPTPAPANATVHIGFHDIFIEGEYLTVRSK